MILLQQHHDQETGEGGEEIFRSRFYRLGKVCIGKRKPRNYTAVSTNVVQKRG